MRNSVNLHRPTPDRFRELNKEDTLRELRYDTISAAISLITDPSIQVRGAAATLILQRAGELGSLPDELIAVLLNESDPTIALTIIESFPRMGCSTERSVPALIALLNDPREQIAVASAQALGALGNNARGAFIPMAILSRGPFGLSNDPRVAAFEGALAHSARAEYVEQQHYVENQLSGGMKVLRARLREALALPCVGPEQSLAPLLGLALCLGSESTRSLASHVLMNLGCLVCANPESQSLIEGALAFTAKQIERDEVSKHRKHEFFEVCRDTRCASGLEYVIANLDMSHDPRLESTRDFTTVYLSEGALCESTVHRMCAGLWEFDSEMVCVAATNLGALVDRLAPDTAKHVIALLFDALAVRAVEGGQLTSVLVAGILYLRGFEAQVVEHCERLVAAQLGAAVYRAVEEIIEEFSVGDPEFKARALGIRKYLAHY